MDRPPARPMRRAGSGRFPVKVSSGAADLTNAQDPASPAAVSRPTPPFSSRSHSRAPSTQNVIGSTLARRPSVSQMVVSGLERTRSNSEGLLQATRSKRMGMVTRKASELGTVVEIRTNRLSHIRGLSHGSAMHTNDTNGTAGSGDGSSSPQNSTETDAGHGRYIRRLSSLPEQKRESRCPNYVAEGAKGVLYALHLVQPHIESLIAVMRDDGPGNRSSLERVFYNATTHLDELDRKLHQYDTATERDRDAHGSSSDSVRRACLTCVVAYQMIGNLLLRNIRKIVRDGDPRYVRTLLLLIYGSLVEIRNACITFCSSFPSPSGPQTIKPTPRQRDRSVTPTQDRPNPSLRSERLRNTTAIKNDGSGSGSGTGSGSRSRRAPGRPPAPLKINGRPDGYANGNGQASHGLAGGLMSAALASSILPTPMSSDGFALPAFGLSYGDPLRSNAIHGTDDADEERQFEKIFLTLTRAHDIVLKVLPSVKHQFVRCIEVCKKQETQIELQDLWESLDNKCAVSMQMAEHLKGRMSTIKLRDPGVRGQREFWELCKSFVKAFVETALLVKDARKMDLIPGELLQILRPVQQAVKEVGVLIDASPWKYLAAPQPSSATLPPPITQAMIHTGLQQALAGMSVGMGASVSGAMVGQYVSPLPATPLSAALGPAAQATVPSSSVINPARNGMFIGNGSVFDRAESLKLGNRTMSSSVADSHGQTPTLLSPIMSRNHPRYIG